jgi:hypothetical protein
MGESQENTRPTQDELEQFWWHRMFKIIQVMTLPLSLVPAVWLAVLLIVGQTTPGHQDHTHEVGGRSDRSSTQKIGHLDKAHLLRSAQLLWLLRSKRAFPIIVCTLAMTLSAL